MVKNTLRKEILSRRRQMSDEACLTRSLGIQERFLQTPEFRAAGSLALYSPVLNEVYTEEIFRVARSRGMRVVYPRVQGEGLDFLLVETPDDLSCGAFGALEPTGGQAMAPEDIDLMVLPGVAFDRAGHRLGYGKGFYDRALDVPGRRGLLVGLCFEQQLIDLLPAEPHDVRMDMLVTEERILSFRGLSITPNNLTKGGGPKR